MPKFDLVFVFNDIRTGSQSWLPVSLCLQKRTVLVDSCPSQITNSRQFADVEVTVFSVRKLSWYSSDRVSVGETGSSSQSKILLITLPPGGVFRNDGTAFGN